LAIILKRINKARPHTQSDAVTEHRTPTNIQVNWTHYIVRSINGLMTSC